MMKDRWWTLALFTALALLYTWQGFLPGRVLLPLDLLTEFGVFKPDPTVRQPSANPTVSDVLTQFLPWNTEIRRHLAAGEMPWVDRFSGGGVPLFSNPQTALFSPFTWPQLLLGERGWALSVLLRLLTAGLGTYWLARELGAGVAAARFSGLVYLGCGHMVLWALHPMANVTAVLPMLGAALLRLAREVDTRSVLLTALCAALATAGGHPESLMTGVVAIFALVVWQHRRRGPGRLGWCALAAGAGFLVLAVVTVPFFLHVEASEAAAVRGNGLTQPFRWQAIVSQVLPGFLGSPLGEEIDLSRALDRAEAFDFRADAFVGLLILVGLALAWRDLTTVLKRALVVGAIGLVSAWCLPLLEPLIARLPLLNVTLPAYRAVGFVLFASAVAGPALFAVAQRQHRRTGVALAVAGGLLLIVGNLPSVPLARPLIEKASRAGIAMLHERGVLPSPRAVYEQRLGLYGDAITATARKRMALPGVAWLVGGLALAVGGRWRLELLVGAAALEILSFGVGFFPSVATADVPTDPPVLTAIHQLDPQNEYQLIAGPGVLPPNLASWYGLRDLRSYVVIEDAVRMRWMASLGYQPAELLSFPARLSKRQRQELAKAGARFCLSRDPVLGALRIGGDEPPAVGLYELPEARTTPLPENTPPPGLALGLALSVLGVVGTLGLAAAAHRQSTGGSS